MSVDLRNNNGIHIATVSGALDAGTGSTLLDSIKTAVKSLTIKKGDSLILDGAGIDSMDVQGLRQLMGVKRAIGEDGVFILTGLQPAVWDVMVSNGCENMFEVKPSVPAAMQSLGASPYPEPAYEGEPTLSNYDTGWDPSAQPADPDPYAYEPAATPAAPVPQGYDSFDPYQPPPANGGWDDEPLIQGGGKPANTPPAAAAGGWGNTEEWANYERASGGYGNAAAAEPKATPFWKKPAFIITLVTVILVVGVVAFILTRPKPMMLVVQPESVEVEEGRGVQVKISLQHGESLDEPVQGLPDGLQINPLAVDESSDFREFEIRGELGPGTGGTEGREATVTFYGRRGVELSEPGTLHIKIKRKKLEVRWNTPFSQPKLIEGEPAKGYSTLVKGAKSVSASGMPDGLFWTQCPNEPDAWELTGTPSKFGLFQLASVSAISATSDRSDYTGPPIVLNVEQRKQEPPPPPPPPPDVVPRTREQIQQPNGLDHVMRDMLLKRIDGMEGNFEQDFSRGDIEQLRKTIEKLKNAKLVGRVTFENSKATISPELKDKVKALLLRDDNKQLLEHPQCYIVVVGYASSTGSMQANVTLSKKRAKALDAVIQEALGKRADLCGDFGPTDIHGEELENRSAEIFAGLIEISPGEKVLADKFRYRFNR